ncbi:MAG: hypothetical protein ACKOAC_01665, partial [Fluviibacter sp.]
KWTPDIMTASYVSCDCQVQSAESVAFWQHNSLNYIPYYLFQKSCLARLSGNKRPIRNAKVASSIPAIGTISIQSLDLCRGFFIRANA